MQWKWKPKAAENLFRSPSFLCTNIHLQSQTQTGCFLPVPSVKCRRHEQKLLGFISYLINKWSRSKPEVQTCDGFFQASTERQRLLLNLSQLFLWEFSCYSPSLPCVKNIYTKYRRRLTHTALPTLRAFKQHCFLCTGSWTDIKSGLWDAFLWAVSWFLPLCMN